MRCYNFCHKKGASPHKQAFEFVAWLAHLPYSIAVLLPEGHRTVRITKIINS